MFKLYDGSKDRKRSQKNKKITEEEKENKTMKKVNRKYEGIDVRTLRGESEKGYLKRWMEWNKAEVSHETGTAVS